MPFFVPDSISLSVGEVISESFGVWGRNLGVFVALGVLAFVPMMVWALEAPEKDPLFTGVGFFYGFVGKLFVTGAVTEEVREAMRGEQMRLQAGIVTGLKRMPGVLVVTLLWAMGLGLGSIFLIIPMFILMASWSVVVPAYVTERPGILGAFPRSSDLTGGYRLECFGVIFLIWLISLIPTTTVTMFTTLGTPVLRAVGEAGAGIITTLSAATSAVLYHRLRALKEAPAAGEMAEVFR